MKILMVTAICRDAWFFKNGRFKGMEGELLITGYDGVDGKLT
jgi:hypothetical protein